MKIYHLFSLTVQEPSEFLFLVLVNETLLIINLLNNSVLNLIVGDELKTIIKLESHLDMVHLSVSGLKVLDAVHSRLLHSAGLILDKILDLDLLGWPLTIGLFAIVELLGLFKVMKQHIDVVVYPLKYLTDRD